MKKKSRHGFHISRFYAIYIAVTVSVILIIIASLGIVTNRLAEYEAAQPKYVAAEVFAKYFSVPINYNQLLADATYDKGSANDAELVEYLTGEIGEEELTYSKGLSNDEGTVKYVVKAGSKQLAAILLSVSGEKTEHGFALYEFSSIELYINTEQPHQPETTEPPTMIVTFDVPSSYSVTVDGMSLATENISSVHVRTDLMKYYPSGVDGIEYTVYTLDTLTELPKKVEVTDLEGTKAEVKFDPETNTYSAGIVFSETLAAEHTEFVTEAVEWYAAYLQRVPGYGAGKIDSYYEADSVAYKYIKTVAQDLWMMEKPSGSEFENVSVGGFYAFSQGIFVCRVSLTQVLHHAGREDNTDVIDMYVFLRLTDAGYRIFEIYNA